MDFERIAEARILEAIEKGQFSNLAGAGKPLELEDLSQVPEELRMAYKILKNAGCVPEEVQLRKDIAQLQALATQSTDALERSNAIKRLNLLLARLDSQRASHLQALEMEYYQKLVEKMG